MPRMCSSLREMTCWTLEMPAKPDKKVDWHHFLPSELDPLIKAEGLDEKQDMLWEVVDINMPGRSVHSGSGPGLSQSKD